MKRPAWWYDPDDDGCVCDADVCECKALADAVAEAKADARLIDRELSERDA